MIQAVRDATKGKIAVITNAALIDDEQVQEDLMMADFIIAKLDACDEDSLKAIDIPAGDIRFQNIIQGIKSFREKYQGRFALQIMFIEHNKKYAETIAEIARDINPDEVQINTPLRPSGTAPLTKEDLDDIKKYFKGLDATTVYEAERRDIQPLDERETVRRHGNSQQKD
jgi:wyosine [tRNA(Phe)-imidazoG37] synthetase (radical SAM superfamily)